MASFFDPLWVVTSYYNPAGYKRRRQNFRAFRRLINAPLLAVELARPGQHQLTRDDADQVVSLTGEDRMWQKERLLNIGINELPPHVEYVAWIDCDMVLEDEAWPLAARARLEKNDGLLQLFESVDHLPRDVDLDTLTPRGCAQYAPLFSGVSIASAVRAAAFAENEQRLHTAVKTSDTRSYNLAIDGYNCYGMGWAARRATIEKCGQYDRNIVGGADSIHIHAALARLGEYWTLRPFTPMHIRDAESWARDATASGLLASIDALPHKIYHLWHGDLLNRNYRGRYSILTRHGYDPAKDIEISQNGTWRWTNPESDLARDVGAYFFARREDGEG